MTYKKRLPPTQISKSAIIEALRNANGGRKGDEVERVIQELLANPHDTVIVSGVTLRAGNSPKKPKNTP